METAIAIALIVLTLAVSGIAYRYALRLEATRAMAERVRRHPVVVASRKHAKRAAKASVQTTFSLRATAAAWTAGELTGRAIDAGWLHMPSVNSARAFLAVFGIVLLCEACHMGFSTEGETAEHAPEKRPAVLATQDERRVFRGQAPDLANPLDEEIIVG